MKTFASELFLSLGTALVGRRVRTIPIGEWPGGECEVISLHDDPGAPEIVFIVRRIADGEECGVFADEPVDLLEARQ